ncbi:hypothetical protein GW17_00020596 [Ensete ventricosum]|nr:hypothetical protein GW17_00020596 [Ensete ventricosum]
MDPEYVETQELTEKSDIYSYGVLLLELVSGRRAIHENRNLVEWSQKFLATDSRLPELVDPAIGDSFDFEQLHMVVELIKWCTHKEGRARPSIKQVLRVFSEHLDPVQTGFSENEEGDGYVGGRSSKARLHRNEVIPYSGDSRCLQSSSSTSRSYCSRSVLLESGSPQSPPAEQKLEVYYVQSPSRDSHDGEKTTATTSFHSTPVLSPMASPRHSHSSVGPQSRDSSSSRFSGGIKPGGGGGPRKMSSHDDRKGGRSKNDKAWKECATIEEEGLLEDEREEKGLPRRCYYLAFLLGFVILFSFFALILWGASRSQMPEITMKVKLPILS